MGRTRIPKKRFGRRPAAEAAAESRTLDFGMGFGWGMGGWGTGTGDPQAPQINSRNVITIAAVAQAIQVYIGAIAPLDFYVARETDGGGWSPDRRHPIYDLVHSRPNPEVTSYDFRATILYHALSTGNGLAEIERGDKNRPKSLWNLDPSTRPVRHHDGTLWYRGPDLDEDLPAANVLHLKAPLSWNAVTGYNPIDVARDTLRLIRSRDVYELALMDNGASPRGHFEWFGDIDKVAADNHLADWNRTHGGPRNAGKTANVRNGKWVQDQLSPTDAGVMEGRNQGVYEVARIFNLPPHKLGLLENASYSTVAQQNLEFYQVSVLPWLVRIEQEWAKKLLSSRDRGAFAIRHNANQLLRLDAQAQAERDERLFNMGAISPNGVRINQGMPPKADPAMDAHYLGTNNYEPIGSASAVEEDPDDVADDPTEADPQDGTETPPKGADVVPQTGGE